MRGRLFVAALIGLAAACGGDKTPTENNTGQNGTTGSTGATGNTGSTGSTSNTIGVAEYNFSPSATTVAVGTIVTWNFSGAYAHNVTFDNTSLGASGDKNNGESFQKQFGAAGTFTYFCSNHYGMTGTITVK